MNSNDETIFDGSGASSERQLSEGSRIGDYVVERRLGAGAMGEVYLARQTRLDQLCALKILPAELTSEADFERRFASEGRALAMLNHPSIVRVLYAGEDAGRHFIAMEYVDGGSLEERLADMPGGLGQELARSLLSDILVGLAYAHGRGVVHRDLKPANVLLGSDGKCRISDFGLALVAGEQFMQSFVQRSILASRTEAVGSSQRPHMAARSSDAATLVGTIDYMSPELRAGRPADARSDIYAVGVMAYQMLTGRKPLGMAKAPSLLCPGLPVAWDAWVDKCMAIDPEERFHSASDAFLAMPKPAEAFPGSGGRRFAKALFVAVLLVLGTVALGFREEIAGQLVSFFDSASSLDDSRMGSVQVRSYPEGADVYMDGSYLGRSPLDLGEVAPGPHSLGIRLKGYRDSVLDFELAPGALYSSGLVSLEPLPPAPALPGGLVVKTDPSGARVRLAGRPEQLSPAVFSDLPPKDYPLEIRLDGYEPLVSVARVESERFSEPPLFVLTRQLGNLIIASTPSTLEWEFASMPKGVMPERLGGVTPAAVQRLPVGEYRVLFRKAGWPDASESVLVEPGHSVRVEHVFSAGSVLIESEPSGALVARQGETASLGVTPLRLDGLPPGSHSFVLTRAGYKSASASVTLNSAEERKLEVPLVQLATPGLDWTVPGIDVEMKWLEPGRFTMGSPEGESGRDSDEVPHQVRLHNGFWMGRCEVTMKQWKALMGTDIRAQLSKAVGDDTLYDVGGKKQTIRDYWGVGRDLDPVSRIAKEEDDLPVYYVSWEDAAEFCRKLNRAERVAGRLPAGYEYRLPSEAEWEYACRAGTGGPIYQGVFERKGTNNAPALDPIAWYAGNSSVDYTGRGWDTKDWEQKQYPDGLAGPRSVATRQPNAWGLHDMLGNMWEWCADWYDSYPSGQQDDPRGPASGTKKVCRGAGWDSAAYYVRAAERASEPPGWRSRSVGFRIVLAKAQ